MLKGLLFYILFLQNNPSVRVMSFRFGNNIALKVGRQSEQLKVYNFAWLVELEGVSLIQFLFQVCVPLVL